MMKKGYCFQSMQQHEQAVVELEKAIAGVKAHLGHNPSHKKLYSKICGALENSRSSLRKQGQGNRSNSKEKQQTERKSIEQQQPLEPDNGIIQNASSYVKVMKSEQVLHLLTFVITTFIDFIQRGLKSCTRKVGMLLPAEASVWDKL